MGELVEGTVVFLVWWSVWSLLDTYTLRFSPLSELAALSCALMLKGAPFAYARVRARVASQGEALKRVLDAV